MSNKRKEEAIQRLKTKLTTSRKLNSNGITLRYNEVDNIIFLLQISMQETEELKERINNMEKEKKKPKRKDIDMGKFEG